MNFFRTALAAAAIAAVSLTSGSAFADKLQDILNAGKVRIGVLADSAPWGFRDGEGKLTGFDVELAALVAADLGVNLEIVEVTGAARLPSLLSDQIDVLVAAAGATPERAQQVMFTSPYVAVQLGVYGKAGTAAYSSPEELAGKSIAVARGTTLDVWLTDTRRAPISCVSRMRPARSPPSSPARPNTSPRTAPSRSTPPALPTWS